MNEKELILKHQLEEWHSLNDYLNQIDTGYLKIITLLMSVCTIATGIIVANIKTFSKFTLMLVPFAIIGVFACLSYQFRITAILRGHLAALEEKMNKELGEEVHLWNSALVDSYMANNNLINQMMMIPMCVCILIFAVIIISSFIRAVGGFSVAVFLYLILIIILSLIVFIPFLHNENVRKEVYYYEKNSIGATLPEFYQKYIRKKVADAQKIYSNRTNEDSIRKRELFKNALNLAVFISFIGFGIMLILYYISPRTGLRGFFSYYAATIGDGICLPALCGFAALYLGDNCAFTPSCHNTEGGFVSIVSETFKQASCVFRDNQLTPFQKKAVGGISIVTSFVGVLIQSSWIIRDNTSLNWTIPRKHHFNLPGWYHAVYFVVMFGLIMYFLTSSFLIYKKQEVMKTTWTYPSIWLSGVAYLLMNTIDDRTNNTNYVMVLILTGLCAIAIYLVLSFFASKLKDRKNIVFIIGVTILVIFAILLCHFVKYSDDPISSNIIYEFLFK